MADISNVTLLDGNTYNLKDENARLEVGTRIKYVLANQLPATGADEYTVYLIPTDFAPSGGGGTTYTLSRANNIITLTGSDSSTSSVDGGLTQTAVEDLIDTTINNVLGVAY